MTKSVSYVTRPRTVHTSVVKKSAATIAPQWAARNVRQDIGRSGTGPIPWLRRIGGDRGSGDAMAKILQRPLDPAVAPRRILPCHPDAQLADLAEHARSAYAL